MSDALDTLAALVASLKAHPSAPWAERVLLHASSQVLEVGGSVKAEAWPMLTLENLDEVEDPRRRRPGDQETVSLDTGAGTITRRPFPRLFTLSLDVVLHARVGFTPDGQTASAQLHEMMEALSAWHAAHPKLLGHNVFLTEATPRETRLSPADVRVARGQLRILEVRRERGTSATTPLSTSVEITRGTTLPDP